MWKHGRWGTLRLRCKDEIIDGDFVAEYRGGEVDGDFVAEYRDGIIDGDQYLILWC